MGSNSAKTPNKVYPGKNHFKLCHVGLTDANKICICYQRENKIATAIRPQDSYQYHKIQLSELNDNC